jgi:hypothetical protein
MPSNGSHDLCGTIHINAHAFWVYIVAFAILLMARMFFAGLFTLTKHACPLNKFVHAQIALWITQAQTSKCENRLLFSHYYPYHRSSEFLKKSLFF